MIKVFCISGLPFEQKEDTLALQELQDKMFEVIKEYGGKSSFDLNLTHFIPKAHTPFQWGRCAESQYFADFIKVYNDSFYESRYWLWDEKDQRKKVKGFTTIKQSRNHTRIQVLFDNGDRRMTVPLITIVLKYNVANDESGGGANKKVWWGIQTLMLQQYGYDVDELLNEKGHDHVFPFDHIDLGTDKEFLWNEYQKASRAEETVPCRDGCAGCGIMKGFKDEAKLGICTHRKDWFPYKLAVADSPDLHDVSVPATALAS